MRINQQNIILFITYLYKQKYGQLPPSEVLNSWQNLSNEEINFHLEQMTKSWGMSEAEFNSSVANFIATIQPRQEQAAFVANAPSGRGASNTSIPNRKKRKNWIWFMLIPIVGVGGFVGYKYYAYNNLEYLFATTDNVAIRDASGKTLGRMDIFENSNSVLSLRARNAQIYNIDVDGKTSESRQLLTEDASFMDYLTGNAEKLVYVNKNYLTNNAEYNEIQKTVFKNVSADAKLMGTLKSNIRKVIIGSIVQNENIRNLTIENPCKSTTTEYTPWIILELKDKKTYSVIVKLSDGKLYKLKGKPDENAYEIPEVMKIKEPYNDNFVELVNENLLFKKIDGYYHIFDCNKTNLGFVAKYNTDGDIAYFNWSYDVQ